MKTYVFMKKIRLQNKTDNSKIWHNFTAVEFSVGVLDRLDISIDLCLYILDIKLNMSIDLFLYNLNLILTNNTDKRENRYLDIICAQGTICVYL